MGAKIMEGTKRMFASADVCHMTSSSIAFLVTNTLYPILRQLNKVEKDTF